jgi:hypothetical protein
MAWIVLSDWGKSQSIYQLTISDAVNALAFPPDLSISQAMPGYQLAVLQMLMPSTWQLYVLNETPTGPTDPLNNYFDYYVPGLGTFAAFLGLGSYGSNPTPQLLQDLFGPQMQNVMNVDQFLYGGGGWNMPVVLF